MRKQLFANLNWLVADRILRLIGSLIIGVWVARYLGPHDFGLLNFALSFVAIAGAIGKFSIEPVVVRELTLCPESGGRILGTVFRLKLLAGAVTTLIVLPLAWFAQPDNPTFFLLVVVGTVGFSFNVVDAIDIFYQAKVMSKYVVVARTAAFVCFAVFRIGVILGGGSVVWFALSNTLELALGAGLMLWIYQRREKNLASWAWHGRTALSLIKDGWPLMASAAFIAVYMRIDQVMIGQILDATQVGIYSVAVRISEVWLFVPLLVTQTVMPYFVQLRKENPERYQQRLMQLYSVMFWSGIVVAFCVVIFGHIVIEILFGRNYADAYTPLVLTIWTGVFIAQGVARGIWMVSENFQRYRLFNNLIVMPANIVLNLILIPRIGIVGASVASLVCIGVGTWFVPLLFRPLRRSTIDLMMSVNPRYLVVKA